MVKINVWNNCLSSLKALGYKGLISLLERVEQPALFVL